MADWVVVMGLRGPFGRPRCPAPAAGRFQGIIFDTKFKLTLRQVVELLEELHDSKGFLKELRMNVGSRYEKEDCLDLEL